MSIAFIFPGQGSQQVGMGQALADNFQAAHDVFCEVDDALGQDLSATMWNGPQDDLTLTENAQPALMAVSMAVVRVLEAEVGMTVADTARFVAGHSLGEYSALAAASTISIADAARLLKIRGRSMQAATPVGTGAMAALIGLDFDAAAEVASEAAQGEVCQAANDNAPGQVVVSGHKSAVERAIEISRNKGARRAVLLPVSAPFHCALMQPAAIVMAEALTGVDMRKPSVPLVANVLARPIIDPDEIRNCLVEQVTSSVRWRESIGLMAADGVDLFCELGTGKVLSGMVKRNADTASSLAIGTPDDIAAAAAELKGTRSNV